MLDLSDLPIIDDHAHMFSLEAKNANPVRSFTMLESPKDIEHQLLYHAAAHALAELYGCEPNEKEIFKLRKAKAQNNFEEFVAGIFAKANIEALIVDPGYPPTITVEDFQDIVPVKVYSVQRIDEHLFDNVMEVSVVKIGNSRGIRFSKTIIERYNIRDTVEMILDKGHIIIKPLSRPRKGWDKAFIEMHANGDDRLIMPDIFEEENLEEWK